MALHSHFSVRLLSREEWLFSKTCSHQIEFSGCEYDHSLACICQQTLTCMYLSTGGEVETRPTLHL